MNTDKVEHKLEGVNKGLPKLPEGGRKWLANNVWWLALLGGIGQLWMAWWLWDWSKAYRVLDDYFGRYLSDVYDVNIFFYLALIVLVCSGALFLASVAGLKAKNKAKGWNVLLMGVLAYAAYGVVAIFSNGHNSYTGFDAFIGVAIGTAVGLYVLFQIREYFGAGHAAATKK